MAWQEDAPSDALKAAGQEWVMHLRAAADITEVTRMAHLLSEQTAGEEKGAAITALLVATCAVLRQFAQPDVAFVGYLLALRDCKGMVVAGAAPGERKGLH